MNAIRFTIVLLLISFHSFAQQPVKDTTDKLSFDTTGYSMFEAFLNDTSFNSLFNYDMDFNSWFTPDSATFKYAFETLMPQIGNNFENIKGAIKDSGYISVYYFVKTKNLPGTKKNYIEDFNFFNHTISYTAPIDTGLTKIAAYEKMDEWKKLFRKVFTENKKVQFKASGRDTEKWEITFYEPAGDEIYTNGVLGYKPGWELTLQDIVLKEKHAVKLLIRRIEKETK